eukprot:jgi/Chrzof1/9023/Cz03g33100.t1
MSMCKVKFVTVKVYKPGLQPTKGLQWFTPHLLLFAADIAAWGGTCAAGVAAIALLQNWLDRKEKHAVDNMTVQAKGLAGRAGPIGNGGGKMKLTEEMLRNHDESLEGDQNDDMISKDALQVPDHNHGHPDDYHYNDAADMEDPRYRTATSLNTQGHLPSSDSRSYDIPTQGAVLGGRVPNMQQAGGPAGGMGHHLASADSTEFYDAHSAGPRPDRRGGRNAARYSDAAPVTVQVTNPVHSNRR